MRKIILILLVCLFPMAAHAGEYEILNQGRLNACTEYAVTTCIDIMGEPTDIDPKKAYRYLNADGYQCITDTLAYYIIKGAIESYTQITPGAIDAMLDDDIPVIVITWQDEDDWIDGDITVDKKEFYGTHASVLIGRTEEYYIGINSWGENWGYGGLYHLYSLYIVGEAYTIEPSLKSIYK